MRLKDFSFKRRWRGILAIAILLVAASILLLTKRVPFKFLGTAHLKRVIMGRFSTNPAGTISEFDEYSVPGDCKSLLSLGKQELKVRGFVLYSSDETSAQFRRMIDTSEIEFRDQQTNCTVTYARSLDDTIWTNIRLKIHDLQNRD